MSDDAATTPAPIIIDLGKQKRKKVKRLRKGGGSLMDDVQGAVEVLQEDGKVAAAAQIVFVVVEEKPEKAWKLKF